MSILFRVLALCILLSSFDTLQAQYEVMTYNLRYATERDGDNAWSKRKADVAALVGYYNPTVLGVQEAVHEQMTYLDATFSKYAFIGVGRDDGRTKGEYSAIFYDSIELKVIASETFWLSERPNEPSFGWGANFRRICTYGSFLDKGSGDTLHVFNAHFDHEVSLARLNGAKVILKRIETLGLMGSQIVVMGDFNCTPTSEPMQAFASSLDLGSQQTATPAYGPLGTFSGFDTQTHLEDRTIDHILVHNLAVHRYRHIDDRRPNGFWPSDHLPVMATVSRL